MSPAVTKDFEKSYLELKRFPLLQDFRTFSLGPTASWAVIRWKDSRTRQLRRSLLSDRSL